MRRRVSTTTLALLVLVGLAALGEPVAARGEPPAARLDRVDYANPGALPPLSAEVGAGTRTQGIARQLAAKGKADKDGETLGALRQIVRWVGRNLREDASKGSQWRTVDQILVDGTWGSHADVATVVGVLARSAGIPTVWVKTLPARVLRDPKHRAASFATLQGGEGQVFLEVHVRGRWQLAWPATAQVFDDYDPRARHLPGDEMAFDKGADPYALVLPNRRDLYLAQVRAHASRVPVPRQPWAKVHDLLAPWRVYVTGSGGAARYASAASKTLGFSVEATFDSQFEKNLETARGKTLIVTCRGKTPVLPNALWSRYLPPGHREILSGARTHDKGWIKHTLADGTTVILILVTEYGPVELAVSEALEG
jgi:hypothetical protein